MRDMLFVLCLLVLAGTGCKKEPSSAKKVDGRYVAERKDDFAWENEYAAFRLYGPALSSENPSNGVDLWLKNSPALVIDTMYGRELKDGRPYHINYDGNLDCYKVGHTSGCGGVVVMTESASCGEPLQTLWVGGPYSSWEVLEQTPDRFVFRLTYDSLLVAGNVLRETLTVTTEAGQIMNRAEVVISAKEELPEAKCAMFEGMKLFLGGGIFLHDTVENYLIDDVSGLVAYAEDALSDKQAARLNFEYNGSTSQGRAYAAVRTPGATVQKIIDGTLVALAEYRLGDTFVYYFGGSWSEWKDGAKSFATDLEWFEAVK